MSTLAQFFSMSGYCIAVLGRSLSFAPKAVVRWREVLRQMWIIGVQSMPLAFFFLFLVGMVFALQTGTSLVDYGQESIIGRIVAGGMVRELGPWMTAFVLVARNGSSMAAEIGTMAVSEEISALRMMSISPMDYICMPRVIAFVVMGPILTVLATGVGILGGLTVAWLQFDLPGYRFAEEIEIGVRPPLLIYWTLLKAVVFALIAAACACGFGLKTRGGALGVGKASRDTVVYSLVLIVFFNYVLTSFYHWTLQLFNEMA